MTTSPGCLGWSAQRTATTALAGRMHACMPPGRPTRLWPGRQQGWTGAICMLLVRGLVQVHAASAYMLGADQRCMWRHMHGVCVQPCRLVCGAWVQARAR